jgi:hypothetical protein
MGKLYLYLTSAGGTKRNNKKISVPVEIRKKIIWGKKQKNL